MSFYKTVIGQVLMVSYRYHEIQSPLTHVIFSPTKLESRKVSGKVMQYGSMSIVKHRLMPMNGKEKKMLT